MEFWEGFLIGTMLFDPRTLREGNKMCSLRTFNVNFYNTNADPLCLSQMMSLFRRIFSIFVGLFLGADSAKHTSLWEHSLFFYFPWQSRWRHFQESSARARLGSIFFIGLLPECTLLPQFPNVFLAMGIMGTSVTKSTVYSGQ